MLFLPQGWSKLTPAARTKAVPAGGLCSPSSSHTKGRMGVWRRGV